MTLLQPKLMCLASLLTLAYLPGALVRSEEVDAKLFLPFEKLAQVLLDFDGTERFENADFQLFSPDRNDYMTPQHSLALLKLAERAPESSEKMTSSGHHRHLVGLGLTGHFSDVAFNGCSAADVYSDTTYDDIYEPVCRCVQNGAGVVLDCYLGDETCSGAADSEVCTGTHEFFYFADADGDLDVKNSCTLCRSENCEGVREICTMVKFNANDEPELCSVVEFFLLGANNTEGTDRSVCEECQICGTAGAGFGIEHFCFDPTDGCDKDAVAHLHHFVPAVTNEAPTGGVFGETCSSSTLSLELYSTVSYADGYSTSCDCDDPSSGAIVCDLYLSQCFSNSCTAISEIFLFDRDSGEYERKSTLNLDTGFWTQTNFDVATGEATRCWVIASNPVTDVLEACTACNICDTAQDGRGISHSCFGTSITACDASEGRARFNFPVPATSGGSPMNSSPTNSPMNSSPTNSVSSESQKDDSDKNTLPLIMGVAFGGLVVIAIVVLVVQRRQVTSVELVADDLTLADSVIDPVETEAMEHQFTIGNDEEMTLGSSVAPPPWDMDDEQVAGSTPKVKEGEMA